MRKYLSILLCALLLTGCASAPAEAETEAPAPTTQIVADAPVLVSPEQFPGSAPEYVSRFDSETVILLSDEGITVDGGEETAAVFTSHDIIYYEDRDTYDSGNPYGEGTDAEKHTAEEAAAHTVVNITAPGAYRVSGKLSAGQIRIDLGEAAYENPDAVVELILEGTDITCTVAPAILFLNTYECDGQWSVETATADVDTSAAGANLILEQENNITGSHVARIYRDKEGEKKLWKQDGAIYSYMSMNIFGPGSLSLMADNEGLDTELHLTINGGNITIYSGNDGINTNEDGVSVTTINGGLLWIVAGLGEEGDGIDSNGYLVINGGIVSASANPAADAGMDSDMGSYINGGTVIALGSTMDWAESDSEQVTMNLQFAGQQEAGTTLVVTQEDGTVVFAYTPEYHETYTRPFSGVILSSPNLIQGQSYNVYLGGNLTGYALSGGIVDVTTAAAYTGGTQLAYTGTDVTMGFGGMGGQRPGGQRPEDFDGEMPEGFAPGERAEVFDGEQPAIPEGGFGDRNQDPNGSKDFEGEQPRRFAGEMPSMPEGETFPAGDAPELPQGETFPDGDKPEMLQDGFGSREQGGIGSFGGEANTLFYMQDKVNAFSGITAAQ